MSLDRTRPSPNHSQNGSKIIIIEYHVGCLLADSRPHPSHGNTNVRTFQGHHIVYSITSHAHDLTTILQSLLVGRLRDEEMAKK